MKGQDLQFRFHNPNTAEETAQALLRLLPEAGRRRLEQALRAEGPAAKQPPEQAASPALRGELG